MSEPPPERRNLTWDSPTLGAEERRQLGGRGATLWMTGLSGSGKSTLAKGAEAQLVRAGRRAYRLDGDNLRHGICSDLGFSERDRRENLRRIAHVSILLADAGSVVIAAAISPLAEHRDRARAAHAEAGLPFAEIFVDAPLDVCEARDPKGLYAKARKGELVGFTGIDAPFEKPRHPELHLRTADMTFGDAVTRLVALAEELTAADGLGSRP